MFQIELAEHVFAIENTYPYVENLCQDYKTQKHPQDTICVTAEEIARENEDGKSWSLGYLESLAIYRKICEKLLEENIILFHCSAIEIDGKAYLFTAPSGTGKSTHTRLWREVFGSRVTMVNDDKPLLYIPKNTTGECTNNPIKVYGTPYAGKDGLQTNVSVPVAGIIILHQAQENVIERLDWKKAYPTLLHQTYRRRDAAGMIQTLELVQQLSGLPIYSLGCTISKEAVMLVYDTVMGEK